MGFEPNVRSVADEATVRQDRATISIEGNTLLREQVSPGQTTVDPISLGEKSSDAKDYKATNTPHVGLYREKWILGII